MGVGGPRFEIAPAPDVPVDEIVHESLRAFMEEVAK